MTWDQPSKGVCVKVGSAIVHASEATSKGGHRFDIDALAACITDPEVQAWLASFPAVLLPRRRDA